MKTPQQSGHSKTTVVRSATVHDPIYKHVDFKHAFNLVSHPYFQLLSEKFQLGLAKQVFPSGSGIRHPHCLGVGHIVLTRLLKLYELSLCSWQDVINGYLAGVGHDVGHWPLSHLGEQILGNHDKRGINLILGPLAQHIRRDGGQPEVIVQILEGKHWLSPLVIHHALAADRIDYIQRDAHSISGANFPVLNGFIVNNIEINPEDGLYVHQRYLDQLMEVVNLYWTQYLNIYFAPSLRACERYAEALIHTALATVPRLKKEAEDCGDDYFMGTIGRSAKRKPRSELGERYRHLKSRQHPFIGYCFSSRPDAAAVRDHQQVVEMDFQTIEASSLWTPEEVSKLEGQIANTIGIDPWLLSVCQAPPKRRWAVPEVKIGLSSGKFNTLANISPELVEFSHLKQAIGCTILVCFDDSTFDRCVNDVGILRETEEILRSAT